MDERTGDFVCSVSHSVYGINAQKQLFYSMYIMYVLCINRSKIIQTRQ
jgi:hypothetical protein